MLQIDPLSNGSLQKRFWDFFKKTANKVVGHLKKIVDVDSLKKIGMNALANAKKLAGDTIKQGVKALSKAPAKKRADSPQGDTTKTRK